jgi:glycosyltransferase involved in cell wall biosynthesis
MSVSVVIPVTGDPIWDQRALHAATTASDGQIVRPQEVIIQRSSSVSAARNEGAKKATSEWLIFLDADDELDPDYIQAMLTADHRCSFKNVIYRPNTIGFYPDGSEDPSPNMIPRRDIYTGNFIVIGAMCRRDVFLESGGFEDYPILEDWDLWLKIIDKFNTHVVDVPRAVYRIGVNPGSRNMNPNHGKIHSKIRSKYRK